VKTNGVYLSVSSNFKQHLSKSKILLPTEIKYLLDNHEAEDSSLQITKADYSGIIPILSLTLHQQESIPQYWMLEVVGHRTSQLSFNSINQDTSILLTDNHPFLWEYADTQSELYINGSGKDIAKTIAELNQIDLDLFGNPKKDSGLRYSLLKNGNGLLAKGARKLLAKYADCLNKFNIQTSIIGGYTPTYSDGKNKYSGETLKLLQIRGSYIVGQDFIFAKADQ